MTFTVLNYVSIFAQKTWTINHNQSLITILNSILPFFLAKHYNYITSRSKQRIHASTFVAYIRWNLSEINKRSPFKKNMHHNTNTAWFLAVKGNFQTGRSEHLTPINNY